MRILLLCGSPRKDGNSSAMADAFTYGAKDASHTVVRFETAYINVNSCIGCRNCWADAAYFLPTIWTRFTPNSSSAKP